MLTDEQAQVAEARPELCLLVQAGAGTGKTHTLVKRLEFLVGSCGLDGSDEVVTLSFSRAAAAEVRKRAREDHKPFPYISVYTFDAYATVLLDLAEPDGAWGELGYDDRIKRATELLAHHAGDLENMARLRHVLIDEAQDLTGVRAAFAGELLRFTGSAFTIFTDESQAIYGFNEQRSTADPPPDRFVDRIKMLAEPRPLESRTLTHQHRAISRDVKRIMAFGLTLAPSVASRGGTGMFSRVHDLVSSLPQAADLDMLSRLFDPQRVGTTAILCRSNAQVSQVSSELTALGVDHRLQKRAGEVSIGPWLALLAQRVSGLTLSRDRFEALVANLPDLPVGNPDELWNELRTIGGPRAGELDLRVAASRLRTGNLPPALGPSSNAGLIVSTIHRAKGLEFDRVILVPGAYEVDNPAEEARVLYVGLSRAREEVWVLDGYRTPGLATDKRTGRVSRFAFGRGGRQYVTGFELLPSDVDTVIPVEPAHDAMKPIEVQEYVAAIVKRGDEVRLVRSPTPKGSEPSLVYGIVHGQNTIGSTSTTLAAAIALRHREAHYPDVIEGARVDMMRTAAGDATVAKRIGLSPSGMWVAVGLRGVVNLESGECGK